MQGNYKKFVVLTILFTNNNILFSILYLDTYKIKNLTVGLKKIKGVKKISSSSLKSTVNILTSFLKNKKIHIKLKGLNKYKKLLLKLLLKSNKFIYSFCDLTAVPHNGCKKPKIKRL